MYQNASLCLYVAWWTELWDGLRSTDSILIIQYIIYCIRFRRKLSASVVTSLTRVCVKCQIKSWPFCIWASPDRKGRWKGLQRAVFGRGTRSIKAVLNMLPWTADPLQAQFINKGLACCLLPVRHAVLRLMPVIKFTTLSEQHRAKCHSRRWSRWANYWELGRRTVAREGHYSTKAERKHAKIIMRFQIIQ